MGSLTVSNKILDKYFGYLKKLDNKAKKSLVKKLLKSMATTPKHGFEFVEMFGAWKGEATSDEIILEISNARVDKHGTETL